MTKTYFSLLTRDDADDTWAIQFGDYEHETVLDERDEYRESGYRAANLKIIRTGDTQAEIYAAVAKLNGE